MRTLEQQIATMDKVRARVLAAPESFDMSYWHSACGTTHCMAGMIELDNTEEVGATDAEAIGKALVPNFAKYFYGATDTTLIWLRARGYALAVGEVAKDDVSGLWVDSALNFYTGELSQEAAAKQSVSNTGCKYCTDCTDCKYCTDCTDCKYCTDCTGCEGCTGCKHCTGCEDCEDCEDCKHCTGCKYCTDCTDCKYCTDCTGCEDCEDCTNLRTAENA